MQATQILEHFEEQVFLHQDDATMAFYDSDGFRITPVKIANSEEMELEIERINAPPDRTVETRLDTITKTVSRLSQYTTTTAKKRGKSAKPGLRQGDLIKLRMHNEIKIEGDETKDTEEAPVEKVEGSVATKESRHSTITML